MFSLDRWQEVLSTLGKNPLRSFLTALGIIFGIASVVSMVSLGEGARRAILSQIGELGIRNIIINSIKPPAEEKASKKAKIKAAEDYLRSQGVLSSKGKDKKGSKKQR